MQGLYLATGISDWFVGIVWGGDNVPQPELEAALDHLHAQYCTTLYSAWPSILKLSGPVGVTRWKDLFMLNEALFRTSDLSCRGMLKYLGADSGRPLVNLF